MAGLARHQRYGIQVDGKEQGSTPHAGRRQGRLATGVSGPHHNDIVFFIVVDESHLFRAISILFHGCFQWIQHPSELNSANA